MAEQRRYIPAWPVTRQLKPGKGNLADSYLDGLLSGYGGSLRIKREFDAAKADIDAQLADDLIGRKGHARAVAALADEYKTKLATETAPFVDPAKKRVEALNERLTAPPKPAEPPTEAQNIAAEHRYERIIRRFESLTPEARRTAIRAALDIADPKILRTLLREFDETGGILDMAMAARARRALMTGDPDGFRELEALNGALAYDGTISDPLKSPLSVVLFTQAEVIRQIDAIAAEAQSAPDSARERIEGRVAELAESRNGGDPGVDSGGDGGSGDGGEGQAA
jgi:hypothetical protein